MLTHRSLSLFAVYLVLALLPNTARSQEKTDDQKFLDDVRNAYSMLRRQGLTEINATVTPDWQSVLATLPPDRRSEALKVVSQLRFTVFADASGKVRVTHRVVSQKLTKIQREQAKSIASGFELSITGFLMSWVPFMMTHLIPEKLDQFVLQDLNNEYLLTFVEVGTSVSVKISKDLVITELKTAEGNVKPLLARRFNGFVLTGYEGSQEDPVAGRVGFKAIIHSAPVAGMLLPKTVLFNTSTRTVPINLQFNFTNYRLKTNSALQAK